MIDDHCTTEWAEKVAAPWADFEFAGRAKIAGQPGHEVYKLTPEQLEAWRKAVAPREAQWAERREARPAPIRRQVMDALKASAREVQGRRSERAP